MLRELGHRRADRRLVEVRPEPIVGVGLEQKRVSAVLRALPGDRGRDRRAADATLADDEDQPTLEDCGHGYLAGGGASSSTTATPLASAERHPSNLRSVQTPSLGVMSTLMSTTRSAPSALA